MSIVIAAGRSVRDYDSTEVRHIALHSFTFAVNHVALDFPCDVVVSLDFDFIKEHKDKLKFKAIITREWSCNKDLGLDLIEIPNAVGAKYKFSGMAAALISDALSRECGRDSYVLGIDGGKGRYSGHKGKGQDDYTTAEDHHYFNLGLKNTINLGMVSSKIGCWPKQSKLPHIRKVGYSEQMRELALVWVRENTIRILKGEAQQILPHREL
jgi:hypothetical protein